MVLVKTLRYFLLLLSICYCLPELAMNNEESLPTLQLDNCQMIYMATQRRSQFERILHQKLQPHTIFCKIIIHNKKNWKHVTFPEYIPFDLLKNVDDQQLIELKISGYDVIFKCLESEYKKINFKELLLESYEQFLLHVNFDPMDQDDLEKNKIIEKYITKKKRKDNSIKIITKYNHGPMGIQS